MIDLDANLYAEWHHTGIPPMGVRSEVWTRYGVRAGKWTDAGYYFILGDCASPLQNCVLAMEDILAWRLAASLRPAVAQGLDIVGVPVSSFRHSSILALAASE
jgi:hypothetical protein